MAAPDFGRITPRQLAALRCRCAGATNREVGRALFIQENTARNYFSEVIRRLSPEHGPRLRTTAICYHLGRRDRDAETPAAGPEGG